MNRTEFCWYPFVSRLNLSVFPKCIFLTAVNYCQLAIGKRATAALFRQDACPAAIFAYLRLLPADTGRYQDLFSWPNGVILACTSVLCAHLFGRGLWPAAPQLHMANVKRFAFWPLLKWDYLVDSKLKPHSKLIRNIPYYSDMVPA